MRIADHEKRLGIGLRHDLPQFADLRAIYCTHDHKVRLASISALNWPVAYPTLKAILQLWFRFVCRTGFDDQPIDF